MPDDAAASEDTEYETTGSGEQPETRSGLGRVPDTMTSVPAVLLAGSLAVGVAPGFAGVVAHAVDEAGAGGAVVSASHRTPAGVFLSLASTAPAIGPAALAVARPKLLAGVHRASRPRRLQSGHLGDHVAWMLLGAAVGS